MGSVFRPGASCDAAVLGLLERAMRPGRRDAALLSACLLHGDAAAQAWSNWLASVGDPIGYLRSDSLGLKRHLPRLYTNLRRNGIEVGRAVEPYLRTALAREQMRSRRYRDGLAAAIAALGSAGVDVTLLRGAAIAEAWLEHPWLRHSHDVDFHVPSAQLRAAAAALVGAGFTAAAGEGLDAAQRLVHRSGLPVCLHVSLLRSAHFALPDRRMLARRIMIEAVNLPVASLAPEDMLLHVCCHAATSASRRKLAWILDAASLVAAIDTRQRALVVLDGAPACLCAPAMRVLSEFAGSTMPVPHLPALPLAPRQRIELVDFSALSMGVWQMLRHGSDGVRVLVLRRVFARLPQVLHALWSDGRFVRARRSAALRPLRALYLSLRRCLQPARGTGARSADP